MAITKIRPYQLFALDGRAPNDRDVNVQLPCRRGFGNLTLLETFVLIAAVKAVGARRVFEFGTFLGATTLNLASNVARDGEVLTLDLGSEGGAAFQDPADVEISRTHFAAPAMDYVGSAVEAKITQLYGDSTKFDFSPWRGTADLVLIDGGHDLATVTADTRNAFELVNDQSLAAVVWHDYANPDYPELTVLLDELSEARSIYHVGDTMLCIWFSQPVRGL
jgi:hypothetical protein